MKPAQVAGAPDHPRAARTRLHRLEAAVDEESLIRRRDSRVNLTKWHKINKRLAAAARLAVARGIRRAEYWILNADGWAVAARSAVAIATPTQESDWPRANLRTRLVA